MNLEILNRMMDMNREDAEAQASVAYLADHLRPVVKKGERVLICFSAEKKGGLGWLMEQAVLQCGGLPTIWGPDYRWKTLLQQAFYFHASMIIAPPLIVLGLCKLKKHTGLPLYIRHAVTAGYPCLDWMIDGIKSGLDCTTSGCFGFGETGIIAGFSCGKSLGVHVRQDTYGVKILDKEGNPVPDGQTGLIHIYRKDDPSLCVSTEEYARIQPEPCICGNPAHRIFDFYPADDKDLDIAELGQQLQSWTSVLDCRLSRTEYGLEMELVVFPGEKLPKLPSVAKQIIRPWNPKHDAPFFYAPTVKKRDFPGENH